MIELGVTGAIALLLWVAVLWPLVTAAILLYVVYGLALVDASLSQSTETASRPSTDGADSPSTRV